MGDEGAKEIANALQINTTLTQLYLWVRSNITHKHARNSTKIKTGQ